MLQSAREWRKCARHDSARQNGQALWRVLSHYRGFPGVSSGNSLQNVRLQGVGLGMAFHNEKPLDGTGSLLTTGGNNAVTASKPKGSFLFDAA